MWNPYQTVVRQDPQRELTSVGMVGETVSDLRSEINVISENMLTLYPYMMNHNCVNPGHASASIESTAMLGRTCEIRSILSDCKSSIFLAVGV